MIVIYAPYPHPHLVRDGWMRRIATIERILAHHERAYVFPGDPAWAGDWRDHRIHENRVAPGATFTFLDFRFSRHHRHLTDLVLGADFVYAHTSHSSQHLLPYYPTGKIVTDLHGIAPEEEALQGKPGRATFFAGFEETMIRQSAALVTVTRSMVDHFARKYPGNDRPTIQLPIVEDLGDGSAHPRPPRAKPVVVYVGGLQRWQNVDLMLQAVAACRDRCEFRFYTDAPAALREKAQQHGVAHSIRIATAAPEELPGIYREADFGFVLRDDIAVNRVSCPTKLSEYLALGVVPIVTLAEIGDFASLGYRYVTLEALQAGRLPDEPTLRQMRRRNREVFDGIQATFDEGQSQLRVLQVDAAPVGEEARSRFLTTLERTSFFPLRGAWLEVERGGGTHRVQLDDIVAGRLDRVIDLPGHGDLTALRIRLGDPPFVTTPVEASLIAGSGTPTRLSLAGDWTFDPYGNWCFGDRDATLAAQGLQPTEAKTLHLRCEWLLLGIEALIVGASPPSPRSAWRERLFKFASKVPGARVAWTTLQRLRGK